MMLKAGCVVLSIWAVLNLVPSTCIFVATVFLDADSPALHQILSEQEISHLDSKVRASINSAAVYANGLNCAFCLTALFVIWAGLHQRQRWAFHCLVVGFSAALCGGIGSDHLLGTVHPEVNIISGTIVLAGLASAAIGVLGSPRRS